ncbi:hypothetical protein F5880DRAFT_1502478 [Lentinula raphanica]|nr:hypothetical protein F5880DRAFT_1502478 [Lentinula raphanica]
MKTPSTGKDEVTRWLTMRRRQNEMKIKSKNPGPARRRSRMLIASCAWFKRTSGLIDIPITGYAVKNKAGREHTQTMNYDVGMTLEFGGDLLILRLKLALERNQLSDSKRSFMKCAVLGGRWRKYMLSQEGTLRKLSRRPQLWHTTQVTQRVLEMENEEWLDQQREDNEAAIQAAAKRDETKIKNPGLAAKRVGKLRITSMRLTRTRMAPQAGGRLNGIVSFNEGLPQKISVDMIDRVKSRGKLFPEMKTEDPSLTRKEILMTAAWQDAEDILQLTKVCRSDI